MPILNVKLSNFRLNAATPAIFSSPTHLSIWSTTRRICGVESPLPNSTPLRHPNELIFPTSWSLSWTERLPDLLAQRAAALYISAVVTPKSKLPFTACVQRRQVKLGTFRTDFFSLATGTVCHVHALKKDTGEITPYTLSFDIIVEQPTRVTLSFADIRITLPIHLQPRKISIEHVGGKRAEAELSVSDNGTEAYIFGTMPALPVHSTSLRRLAHGTLRIRVSGLDATLAQTTLPIYRVWSAIAHPAHRSLLHIDLADDIPLLMTTTSDHSPPLGQMCGGVTTDVGITGARPVIFGVMLPDTPHISQNHILPPGWITFVDTFRHRYYHNVHAAVDVWTLPQDETVTKAIQNDELRALQHGFERSRYGIFRNQLDGTETWIHPDAFRLSASSYTVPSSMASLSSPTEHEFSSLSSSRKSSDLHPATFISFARVSQLDVSIPHKPKPEMKERIVEMKWRRLPPRSYAPGIETEGHTFTSVNGGKTILKFGGSSGSGGTRVNKLHAYDVETSTWREVCASGVPPAARTGHGAVALGMDSSRLLIFGGSSPQGRRNDLHMFHVASKTWSPLAFTGTPPAVRARMGMTVTSDGLTALVFGGRSLYRYLGGKYYDPLFVNAFHAERSEWVQIRPQGSGPRPAPRSGCVAEFINNRHMLVHGGYDDGDRFFNDTFLFDMVSESWQKVEQDEASQPRPRESHASAMLGGNVVIYGGDSRSGLLSDLHMFDSGLMRWGETPSLVGDGPGRISGCAMTGIDDSRLLLVGGDVGFKMTRAVYKLEASRRSTIDAKGMTELVKERGPDARACVVCMDAAVDTMFLWCGHSVCCRSCSRLVKRVCPVCRQTFSEVVYNTFDN